MENYHPCKEKLIMLFGWRKLSIVTKTLQHLISYRSIWPRYDKRLFTHQYFVQRGRKGIIYTEYTVRVLEFTIMLLGKLKVPKAKKNFYFLFQIINLTYILNYTRKRASKFLFSTLGSYSSEVFSTLCWIYKSLNVIKIINSS